MTTTRRLVMGRLLTGLGLSVLGGTALFRPAAAQPMPPPGARPGYPPMPELRPEPAPPPPPPGMIWRPGHWVWNGRRYAWFPGQFVRARRGWHEWVPGGWERRHGADVWVGPHWR